jgi:hypothetical protein
MQTRIKQLQMRLANLADINQLLMSTVDPNDLLSEILCTSFAQEALS